MPADFQPSRNRFDAFAFLQEATVDYFATAPCALPIRSTNYLAASEPERYGVTMAFWFRLLPTLGLTVFLFGIQASRVSVAPVTAPIDADSGEIACSVSASENASEDPPPLARLIEQIETERPPEQKSANGGSFAERGAAVLPTARSPPA
ncbi:MAG: hypothetical protein AAGH87_07835 [Pseudomonadota bacterium]